jgi:hypothetical protein
MIEQAQKTAARLFFGIRNAEILRDWPGLFDFDKSPVNIQEIPGEQMIYCPERGR